MDVTRKQINVFCAIVFCCVSILAVPRRSVAEDGLKIHDILSSKATFVLHVKDFPNALRNGKRHFYDVCFRQAIDAGRLEHFFLPIDQGKAVKTDQLRWFQLVANAVDKSGQNRMVADTMVELATRLSSNEIATKADEDSFIEHLSMICPKEVFIAIDRQDETQVLSFGFSFDPKTFDWFSELVSCSGLEDLDGDQLHFLKHEGLYFFRFQGAVYGSNSLSYAESLLDRLSNAKEKFRSLKDSRSFSRVEKRLNNCPGYDEFDIELFANVDKLLKDMRSNVSSFTKTGDPRDKLGNFFPVTFLGVGLSFDRNKNHYQYRVTMPTIRPSSEHVDRMLSSALSLDANRSRTLFPFAKESLFRKSNSLIEDLLTSPQGSATGIDLAIDKFYQSNFDAIEKQGKVESEETCHLKVWPCNEEVHFFDQVTESNSIIDPMSKYLFRNPDTLHPLVVTRATLIQEDGRHDIGEIDKKLNLAKQQVTKTSSSAEKTNRFNISDVNETKLLPKSNASWLDSPSGVFFIRHVFPAMSPTVDFSETKKKIVQQIAVKLTNDDAKEFRIKDWWGTNLQDYGDLKTVFVSVRPSQFNYSENEPFTCLLGFLDLKFDQLVLRNNKKDEPRSAIIELGESLFSLTKTNSQNTAMPIIEHNQYHAICIVADDTHWEFHGLVRSSPEEK